MEQQTQAKWFDESLQRCDREIARLERSKIEDSVRKQLIKGWVEIREATARLARDVKAR